MSGGENIPGDDQEQQELLQALQEHYPEDVPERIDIGAGDLPTTLSPPPVTFQAIPEAAESHPSPSPVPQAEPTMDSLPDFDPNASVDEMLLEAVLPADLAALPDLAEAPIDSLSAPSFQLQFQLSHDQFPLLRDLALAQGLEFRDSPIFSQLTEYQALAFRQAALAQGIHALVSVKFPMPGLSEEDQALGDLAAVAEEPPVVTEGAPQVALPKREREVFLCGDTPPGIHLRQSLGIVTAHRSIARRFFREEEAQEKLTRELERMAVKGAALPASRAEALFRELFLDLQKSALARGGNAVLGLRLEAFPETTSMDPSLEQLRLVAFGTAAVVEKA